MVAVEITELLRFLLYHCVVFIGGDVVKISAAGFPHEMLVDMFLFWHKRAGTGATSTIFLKAAFDIEEYYVKVPDN